MAEPTREQVLLALKAARDAGDQPAMQAAVQRLIQMDASLPPAQRQSQPGLPQQRAATPFDVLAPDALESAGFRERVTNDVKILGNGLIGMGETGLSMLTGAIGSITGLVAGSGEKSAGAPSEHAAQTIREVAQAMTYVPRTESGQQQVLALGEAMAPVATAMDYVGRLGGLNSDPFIAEWLKSAMGMIPGTRLRSRLPENVNFAQERGFRIAPSDYNSEAGVALRGLERFGGRSNVEQRVVNYNQARANEWLARNFMVPRGTPLTPNVLSGVEQRAFHAYEELANSGVRVVLGPKVSAYVNDIRALDRPIQGIPRARDPAVNALQAEMMNLNGVFRGDSIVAKMRELRDASRRNLNATANSETARLGTAQYNAARALENQLDVAAFVQRRGPEYEAFTNARNTLAQLHLVEDIIDEAGNINLPQLTRRLRTADGKWEPGILEELARINSAFPKSTRFAPAVGAVTGGISQFDLLLGAPFGAAIGSYMGYQGGGMSGAGMGGAAGMAVGLGALVGSRAAAQRLAIRPRGRHPVAGALAGAGAAGVPQSIEDVASKLMEDRYQ